MKKHIVRQRFVELGFEQTLNRKTSPTAGAKKLLDGKEEAKVIAIRLGSPPAGYGKMDVAVACP